MSADVMSRLYSLRFTCALPSSFHRELEIFEVSSTQVPSHQTSFHLHQEIVSEANIILMEKKKPSHCMWIISKGKRGKPRTDVVLIIHHYARVPKMIIRNLSQLKRKVFLEFTLSNNLGLATSSKSRTVKLLQCRRQRRKTQVSLNGSAADTCTKFITRCLNTNKQEAYLINMIMQSLRRDLCGQLCAWTKLECDVRIR